MDSTPWIGPGTQAHCGPVTALLSWQDPSASVVVAVGCHDGVVRVWDGETGDPIGAPLAGHDGPVTALALAIDAAQNFVLASGGSDGRVISRMSGNGRVFDGVAVTATATGAAVTGLAPWRAANGRCVVVASRADGAVTQSDTVSGESGGPALDAGAVTGVTRDASSGAAGVAANEAAAVVAWGGEPGRPVQVATIAGDRTIRVWDPATGAPVRVIPTGQAGGLTALVAWQDAWGATVLSSGAADGTVAHFSAADGTSRAPMTAAIDGPVETLSFSVDRGRRRLVCGGRAGALVDWEPLGGEAPRRLAGHLAAVHATTAWTRGDGGTVVASAGGHGLVLWHDGGSGEEVGEPVHGSPGPVTALLTIDSTASTPWLVTGGADGVLRRWNVKDGTPYGPRIIAHGGPITSLGTGWWREGSPVIASGGTGDVRRWKFKTGEAFGPRVVVGAEAVVATVEIELEKSSFATAFDTPCAYVAISGTELRMFDRHDGSLMREIELPSPASDLVIGVPFIGRRNPAIEVWTAHPSTGTVLRWTANGSGPVGDPLPYAGRGPARFVTWLHEIDEGRGNHFVATVSEDGLVTRWLGWTATQVPASGMPSLRLPGSRPPVDPPARPVDATPVVSATTCNPGFWTSSTSPRIAMGSVAGPVTLVPVFGDEEPLVLEGHVGAVRAMVGLGRDLLTAGDDGTVRRWRQEKRRSLLRGEVLTRAPR